MFKSKSFYLTFAVLISLATYNDKYKVALINIPKQYNYSRLEIIGSS